MCEWFATSEHKWTLMLLWAAIFLSSISYYVLSSQGDNIWDKALGKVPKYLITAKQWDVLRFHRSWKKMSLLGCPTKSNKLQIKIKQSCHWGNSFCSTTDPSHVFDLRQDLVFIPKYQSTENRSHFLHIFMLCKQMETMAYKGSPLPCYLSLIWIAELVQVHFRIFSFRRDRNQRPLKSSGFLDVSCFVESGTGDLSAEDKHWTVVETKDLMHVNQNSEQMKQNEMNIPAVPAHKLPLSFLPTRMNTRWFPMISQWKGLRVRKKEIGTDGQSTSKLNPPLRRLQFTGRPVSYKISLPHKLVVIDSVPWTSQVFSSVKSYLSKQIPLKSQNESSQSSVKLIKSY